MNRALPLLIPALLLGPVPGRAQAAPGSGAGWLRVTVAPAVLWGGTDDRMASPVRYGGHGFALGASAAGGRGDLRWTVSADFSRPRLTSRLTTDEGGYEETARTSGYAELLRSVWDNGAARVWAGPGIGLIAGVRRHVYDMDTWLNFGNAFGALQAVGRLDVSLGRAGRISETLALPVVGVAVRKAYASVTRREQAVTLALPPDFLMIRHRLEYRVPTGAPVGARLFHEGLFLRHRDPLDLATVVHRVGMALEWRRRTP